MDLLQAIILAVIQGATELFPVSSLGHAVILPTVLHWGIDEHDKLFLPYLTFLHVGTLIALVGFFWRDWWALFTGAAGLHGPQRQMESIRLLALLVVGTIPLAIVGAALEHTLRIAFGSAKLASIFLIVNGVLLLLVEWRRNQKGHQAPRPLSTMTYTDAIIIGLWQCLALLPGISRSGSTINGGLRRGLDHENATRFALLLGQPAILAAAAKEGLELRHAMPTHEQLQIGLIGCAFAGVTALIATSLLVKFMRNHDDWALTPFGMYCIAAGSAALIYLQF